MNRHATAADLQLYVLDALGGVPKRWLEAHVIDCDHCARSLTAEAALESSLQALWPALRRPLAEVLPLRPPAPPRRTSPPPARRSPGSGLAAAAVALLFLGWWADGGSAVTPAVSTPLACLTPGFSTEMTPARTPAACREDDGEAPLCAPRAAVCSLPAEE